MGNWPKGPWYVRDFGKTQDGDDYHFVQAGGPSVGDGWDEDGKYMVISGVISRDAANLISAAPDLFDALQAIYGKLVMSDRDGDAVITKEDGLLAAAALAKATGAV